MNKKGNMSTNSKWILSIVVVIILGLILFRFNLNLTTRFAVIGGTCIMGNTACIDSPGTQVLDCVNGVWGNPHYVNGLCGYTGSCNSNCVNKCGGVSDGCGGYCNAACSTNCFSASDLDSSGKMTRTVLGKAISCWVAGN